MYILGIESSCDETAAAIVEDGKHLISNVISTSVKEQALYGGVVPEIASRKHVEAVTTLADQAVEQAGLTKLPAAAMRNTSAQRCSRLCRMPTWPLRMWTRWPSPLPPA